MALKLEPPKKRSRASPFEIGSGFLLWFSVCVALFFFLPSVVAERQTKTMIYVGVMAKKKLPPTSVLFVLCDLSVFPLCFSVCPLFLGSSCFCFFFRLCFPPLFYLSPLLSSVCVCVLYFYVFLCFFL